MKRKVTMFLEACLRPEPVDGERFTLESIICGVTLKFADVMYGVAIAPLLNGRLTQVI
jgi:hypothetical protein